MKHPNFVLLYVDSPAASAEFYSRILNCTPVESSPTFAMFALDSGLMLGCWQREGVLPQASAQAGANEIAIALDTQEAVLNCYQQWQQNGVAILQEPCAMDFGFTFVAADPDGHRIRVFLPH